jgi:glucose-1-phosphate cytidylyltransferase
MKVVILAGGLGTRLSEETGNRPKPMVEIGDKPILWHIMKTYSYYGFNEFVICAGYKSYMIKEYFHNFWLHNCDVTFDMRTRERIIHQDSNDPWRVTVVDTGNDTPTGGRIQRIQPYIGDAPFLLTYGDGVADVDISKLVEHHRSAGKLVTVTAVQPIGRFGAMEISSSDTVLSFQEKPRGDGGWINGGFFVVEPGAFGYLGAGDTMWEENPIESIVAAGELSAYHHRGFWQPMDTLRDKRALDALWKNGTAPWKLW